MWTLTGVQALIVTSINMIVYQQEESFAAYLYISGTHISCGFLNHLIRLEGYQGLRSLKEVLFDLFFCCAF